jgi:hypothetical protein
MNTPGRFPFAHYCYWTPPALYRHLPSVTDAEERKAILFILEHRMRRAAVT